MVLLRELIEIPEQVHKSDFVISLETAVREPERTLADYVVTPQLEECFDKALSLVTSAVTDHRSKAAYLHASFGAGKTAMMAVLHLLLQGNLAARSKPELAPLIAKYAERIDGRKFLLVPFHFVGAESIEQVILGGYVEHIRELHPGVALPPVYVADGILADARNKRAQLGDDVFFRVLGEGEAADEWGDYGTGWDADRFDRAIDALPGDSEHDELIGALLRTHYSAVPGQAQATAEGFVPLDAGLEAISRHAQSLKYDAVILFLDELVLWLAARMSEVAFVSREGAKVVKLVEGDASKRPAPLVSFIARQRDLKELVGDTVPGVQAMSAMDVLRHHEGRFDSIRLDDRNLPVIAEKRLLRPRSEAARQQLDDAFTAVRRQLEERNERDVLLSTAGDLDAFRRLYPFSPALVDSLVALSGTMQRERTALKVMLQLLVENRNELEVGQLVPLGDLFDAINSGDEPLTEVMRAQFQQARRLWSQRFEPMLLRDHGLADAAAASGLPRTHGFVTDSRLIKSLLVGALVPEVGPLRNLTVSRLTALNSGIVRAFVPGTERQQVLERLRRWAAEVGELRLGDDEQDPTVGLVLSGIDTAAILATAQSVDSDGTRKRLVRTMLDDLLQVKDRDSLAPWVEVTWKGTRRRIDVLFVNVRDTDNVTDDVFRSGHHPKLVLDYPWDTEEFGPADDRARVQTYIGANTPEWTGVWLPNFFSRSTQKLLGKLVQLEHLLTGDQFERSASHLNPTDRAAARTQLANEQAAVRERIQAALRQAFGVDPQTQGTLNDGGLAHEGQYLSLDPSLQFRAPVGTSLRLHLEALADQLYRHRYPRHPEFTELITTAELRHTRDQVLRALQEPNGRLENVDTALRKTLTKVTGPLRLGNMHAAHFIAEVGEWVDIVDKRRSAEGASGLTVGQVRRWLDGEGAERRGLTDEVADLVIVCVAAATNRVFLTGGQPVAKPEIGKLGNDWELKPQDLPTPEQWQRAVARATDMGVVPTSTLLTATSVADLATKVHGQLLSGRTDGVRALVTQLEAAVARLGAGPSSARLRTARAAVAFAETARRSPDHVVVHLAEAEIPTSAAALGTSIAQAAAVAGALEQTNWELLGNSFALGGESAGDAARSKARLLEAVEADELACALRPRLGEATAAATDLLTRAAAPRPEAPRPTSVSPAPPPSAGNRRAAAEQQLTQLSNELLADGLLLRWTIEDA